MLPEKTEKQQIKKQLSPVKGHIIYSNLNMDMHYILTLLVQYTKYTVNSETEKNTYKTSVWKSIRGRAKNPLCLRRASSGWIVFESPEDGAKREVTIFVYFFSSICRPTFFLFSFFRFC